MTSVFAEAPEMQEQGRDLHKRDLRSTWAVLVLSALNKQTQTQRTLCSSTLLRHVPSPPSASSRRGLGRPCLQNCTRLPSETTANRSFPFFVGFHDLDFSLVESTRAF